MSTTLAFLARDAASLWLLLAVGGSVLLLIALASTRLLSRVTAATRFAIWTSAMAGLTMLAVGRLLLPALPVPSTSPWLLALRAPSWSMVPTPEAASAQPAEPRGKALPGLGGEVTGGPAVRAAERLALAEGGTIVAVSASATPARRLETTMPTWMLILIPVWLGGSLLMLLRTLHGTWVVAQMARRAPRSLEGAHWTLLQQISEAMNVQRPVTLRLVNVEQIPLTTGLVHPNILLPRTALTWSPSRVAMVLQHEMAHIARFDLALASMAQVALLLCWWHPLAWYAMYRMEQEREHACDDRVLSLGVAPTDYADELLGIVRALRIPAPPAFAALGMARQSQVESRLRALLQPGRPRRRASRFVVLCTTAVAVAILPLGRLVPTASAKQARQALRVPPASAGAARAAADTVRSAPMGVPLPPPPPPPSVPGGAVRPTSTASASASDARRAAGSAATSDEFALGGPCAVIGWGSSIGRSRNDSLERYYRVDGTGCIRMSLRGKVQFTADDQVASLSGASPRLTLESTDRQTIRRLTMSVDRGVPVIDFWENGVRVSTAEGEAWAPAMYLWAARDVGLDAERRVSRLLQTGSSDAFLNEMRLIRADDVRQRYYQLALANPGLRGAALTAVINAVDAYVETLTDRDLQRQLRAFSNAARAR